MVENSLWDGAATKDKEKWAKALDKINIKSAKKEYKRRKLVQRSAKLDVLEREERLGLCTKEEIRERCASGYLDDSSSDIEDNKFEPKSDGLPGL